MNKEYRIDPELKSIMSELAEDEKDMLENSRTGRFKEVL